MFAVLAAVVFGTAFALALTIQLWSEYRVDREGLMHLQVKYSKVHSEAAVTADRVEVKCGTITFPAVTSSSSLLTGKLTARWLLLERCTPLLDSASACP